ncbi:MAG: hypothetical protein GX581_00975 [Syntrophomonadaceae bacterium]|jgi:hypothetical protein|nr:hypothetical protein [Syntrophomonadaceae bacterium]
MNSFSRFKAEYGQMDEELILNWTEAFFFNLMNVLNSFLSHLDIGEAVCRLRAIPFDELVTEQLEGESEETIRIAVARINELREMELEFMDAYR